MRASIGIGNNIQKYLMSLSRSWRGIIFGIWSTRPENQFVMTLINIGKHLKGTRGYMRYITDTSTLASKVIHLDSAHAHVNFIKDDEGNILTTNFVYHMKEPIVCPNHLSTICTIHTATIPYTFYNVRSGINNELILNYVDIIGFRSGRYKIVFPTYVVAHIRLLGRGKQTSGCGSS